MIVFVLLLGLIAGSFVSAVTWRLPRNLDIWVDRSRCDNCKKRILWYNNIPLLSYILLRGKCGDCGQRISLRYPLLELVSSLIFILIYSFGLSPIYYFLSTIFIAIFVIDLEHQIIPDELVFLGILITFCYILFTSNDQLYGLLFSGFAASMFLLLVNLATRGRGMGFGDVKFAILGGMVLGYPHTVSWLFLSFISGALIGVLLIAFGKAHFGRRIAFGPFLILSLFIVLFWGEKITLLLLPYLY